VDAAAQRRTDEERAARQIRGELHGREISKMASQLAPSILGLLGGKVTVAPLCFPGNA